MSFPCPHCGAAIEVLIRVQSAEQSGATASAIQSANGQIAHDSVVPAPKGRRRYNEGYDQEFLRFWEAYPIHRNKRQAYRAWGAAIRRMIAIPGGKLTASQSAILAGAIRYKNDPNRVDEYTQHAATWLNGDGWEDEPLPFRLKPQTMPPEPPRSYDHARADAEIARALEETRRQRG